MRRLTWLVCAILTVGMAVPAFAQTTAGKNVGISVGAGIGYGTVPDGTDRKIEGAFNGGLVAVLPLSENWAFQPELRYDKRKVTTGGITTEVSYVTLPVLLRNKFLGIYMVQGVSFNAAASASIFDVDFKDAIQSPDVSIVLGVGKRFERWSLEARWETGLRNLPEGRRPGRCQDARAHSRRHCLSEVTPLPSKGLRHGGGHFLLLRRRQFPIDRQRQR